MIATIATAEPVPITHPAVQTQVNPIETLQKTVSASRLNCWLGCRLKFFFRYVQQIIKPPTPSLHVGTVVHLVLQAWNMARWRKQAFEIERFKNLFEKGWANQPTKINWEDEEPAQKIRGMVVAWSCISRRRRSKPTRCRRPLRCQWKRTYQSTVCPH